MQQNNVKSTKLCTQLLFKHPKIQRQVNISGREVSRGVWGTEVPQRGQGLRIYTPKTDAQYVDNLLNVNMCIV